MKNILSTIAVVIIFNIPMFAQSRPAAGAVITNEADIYAAIDGWAAAVRDRDMKALDELFDDDLIVTTHDGKVRDKAEELEMLKPRADLITRSVTNENLRVREFDGRTAIVTGIVKMHFVIDGKDVRTAYRYTAVFIRWKGPWRLNALQTAQLDGK